MSSYFWPVPKLLDLTFNMKITKEIVLDHGLSEEEYQKILELMGREPNMLELGIFSVMWSEHCSYKSSRIHLKSLPTDAPHVLQGPGENAGIVDIGEGLALVFKMESHNHPSYIEPYQGAATGVGGILRDIFTMGARPVASLNSLRFGSIDHPKTRRLVEGVVAGIAGYGNCMGVPTVGGEVYFNESYNGNNLVNAMSVGIVKSDKIFLGRAEGVDNPVMYVGSKTGRDGVHGATMASDVFGEGGEERRPTVQVGDPFTEKLLLEACLEVFKTDYVIGIQDMGAAGLTSSSVEMAGRVGNGIELDLTLIPKREDGISPYEIMLSESQERMLLVVRKGCEDNVAKIYQKWGLDAIVIGQVTGDGVLLLKEGDSTIAELSIQALTENAPIYDRPVEKPDSQDDLHKINFSELTEPSDYNDILLKLLSSPNICSKRWIYEQYDHMVRTDTVVPPGSDSAVIRIKGTNMAIAMTTDCNSRYCYLDPFTGTAIAVAEAARNLVSAGARPLALTDCLNFGSPERPEIMWQFTECISGMRKACEELGIPVISGNVSFYNETSGAPIYPTPTIGMVGIIDNISNHITQPFKVAGNLICLLGETRNELGGSEYLSNVHGLERGMPPYLDLSLEKRIQNVCLKGIKACLIKSTHDCSEGGIAVALAESCITGDQLGAIIEIEENSMRSDVQLFSESQSRIVLSLEHDHLDKFKEICEEENITLAILGKVGGDRLIINNLIDLSINELLNACDGGFDAVLRG